MRFQGLSIQQAPPFIVVSSFFITSSALWFLFSVVHSLAILKSSFTLPSFIHTFTVSFALITMFGALYQMLPVVAGAVIENPVKKAFLSLVLLLPGAIVFPISFYFSNPTITALGAVFVYVGSLYTLLIMGSKLYRIKAHIPTSYGMKYTFILFLIGISLGFYTVLSYTGYLSFKGEILQLHFKVLLFGWIGLLIASVSFRVIEMFFVTEPYPKMFSYRFPELVSLSLLLSFFIDYPLLVLYCLYALVTLWRLYRRKRKISEATIPFWYLGMVMLLVSLALYPFSQKGFYYAFLMFFTSIIMGMMQRIIPFLVWFHLSNEGVFPTPLMSDVINPRKIKLSFYLLLVMCVSLLLSLVMQTFIYIFAVFYLVTSLVLFYNVLSGSLVYFRLRRRPLLG